MKNIKKTGQEIQNQVTSFLAGKPVWMYLATGVAVTALIFLAFYLVAQVLIGKWWISIILILLIGCVLGFLYYRAQNPTNPATDTKTTAKKAPIKKKK